MLALLSTGFLVYNMLATLIYKEQIFFERETLSNVEIVILIGFSIIILFDIVSFLWILSRLHQPNEVITSNIVTLILGALCMILLIGEKAMIDEIGREYLLGWEVLGEWIILYVFLTTQLIYNFVVLLKLFRTYNARFRECRDGMFVDYITHLIIELRRRGIINIIGSDN
ncbi:hypothetical protein ACFL4Z_00435 [candidate division KSB1 bacterium]